MSDARVCVLVIEDSVADAALIRGLLEDVSRLGWNLPTFEIDHVRGLQDGLARIEAGGFDIVITDLSLPDSPADETFARLYDAVKVHASNHGQMLPIVVVTGREDVSLARQTVRDGADDFLFKREMRGSLLAHTLVNALERQHARQALQAREALLRQVVDLVPYPIFAKDAEGRFLLVNQAGAAFAGLTVEQMQGHPESTWVEDASILRHIQAEDLAVIEAGEPCFFPEDHFIDAQGEHHVMQTTKIPFQPAYGEPMGLLGISIDITERVRAEQEIRDLKDFYGLILDNVRDGIWVTDAEDRLVYFNPAMERIAGLKAGDVLGLRVTEDFPPETIQHFRPFYERAKTSGRLQSYEADVVTPGGRTTIQAGWLIPRLEAGAYAGMICTIQDITERRRAEEAYRALVTYSLQGLCIIQDEQVVFANQALADMFEYEIEELLDLSPADAMASFTKDGRDFVREQRRLRRLDQPMAHRYEIQVYTKDGDLRWTEQFVSPILYRGRPALQIAVTDITERKKAQAELAASLQQKEVLLREVHHRVKNNLAVAASMLGLQTLESDDPNLEAVLARSQERLYAMGRVHEHLYRTRDLRAVDMRDYLSGLVTHLQHSLGRPDIELVFDVDDVKLDLDTASPCGLIVNELVTNAFKHAFPETAPREGQAQYKIHVSLQREGDSLTLTVRDNGVGLKPDALAAPSLGIQLVQLLTSNLNGTFRAKVLPDRPSGATFTVRFNAGEITP